MFCPSVLSCRPVCTKAPMLGIDVGADYAAEIYNVWAAMTASVPRDPDFDSLLWSMSDAPQLMMVSRIRGYGDASIVYDSRFIVTWGDETGETTRLYLVIGSDWYHIHDVRIRGGVLMLEINPEWIERAEFALASMVETPTEALCDRIMEWDFVKGLVRDLYGEDRLRGMTEEESVEDVWKALRDLMLANYDDTYSSSKPRPTIVPPISAFAGSVDWRFIVERVLREGSTEGESQ